MVRLSLGPLRSPRAALKLTSPVKPLGLFLFVFPAIPNLSVSIDPRSNVICDLGVGPGLARGGAYTFRGGGISRIARWSCG
jgi:hypothetical protein